MLTINRSEKWRSNILSDSPTIKEAIEALNGLEHKIALVIDSQGVLVGTITDGDVRRGLLRGVTLDSSVNSVLNDKAVVASELESDFNIMKLMREAEINIVPLVKNRGILCGLAVLTTQEKSHQVENFMLIMAGGLGSRLRPLTENCPKPMIIVAGKPILEHILDRAKGEGFYRFKISVNYLADRIIDYFGDGSKFGVEIEYLVESKPLGTAGAIGLLEDIPDKPFIVTNGDVVSDIKYAQMLKYHEINSGFVTVAVRQHVWQNPFGVIVTSGNEVKEYDEKPRTFSTINAGVYVLEKEVKALIPSGQAVQMSELILGVLKTKRKVVAYPVHESWIDVGQPDDLLSFSADSWKSNS